MRVGALSGGSVGSYFGRCWLQDGAFWAILGDVGASWWQDDVTRTRDEATYAKKTAGARNWEPLGGSNGRTRPQVGGGPPPTNLQTGDSRLRLRLELETPTPTASPDSDCKRNWMNWMIEDSDWSWMDWMIGDSDWSLRREFEHATVPTARWRIILKAIFQSQIS